MYDLDGLTADERALLLKELSEAIASGALKIKFQDREVTYRSLSEMRLIRSDLQRRISGSPRTNIILSTFNRGL